MRKYWIGESYAKMLAEYAIGWTIMVLLSLLLHETPCISVIIGLSLSWLTTLFIGTHLVGLWTVFWVEDGMAYEQRLFTRKIRSMSLYEPNYLYRWTTRRTTWLVVTEMNSPAESVKMAKSLYRQGKAMIIPIEGPLQKPLFNLAEKAYSIE